MCRHKLVSRQIFLTLLMTSLSAWLPIFPVVTAAAAPANKEAVRSIRTGPGARTIKENSAKIGSSSQAASAVDREKQVQPGDRPIRDKWAVVIGINEFQDKRIPQLKHSVKDAKDFADFLVNYGNFAKDHVLLLTNQEATDDQIKRAIGDDWLPRRVLDDDVVLIYASTHGSPKELDVAGQNFLVAYNSNPDDLFSTSIELDDLASTIKRRTRCDRVVLLLDACNSGAAAGGGGKGMITTGNFDVSSIAGDGVIVISSSSATQRSWESTRYANGVFTHSLMEAFKKTGTRTRIADAFADLKDAVEQEVMFDRKASQTPVMMMNWTGKTLSVMAPPVKPRPTQPYQAAAPPATSQPAATSIAPSDTIGANSTANNQVPGEAGDTAQQIASAAASSGAVRNVPPQGSNQGSNSQSTGYPATSKSSLPVVATVQLPGKRPGEVAAGSIGLVGFGGPQAINVSRSEGVLWGIVERPDELRGLPQTLDRDLGKHLGNSASALSTANIAELSPPASLTGNPASDAVLSRWKAEDFKKAGVRANLSYFLYGTINEVSWYPTTWSNRYSIVATATLVDASSGKAIASANRITVCKAPWTADMSGGKAYFENYVVPALTDELLKELRRQSKLKF